MFSPQGFPRMLLNSCEDSQCKVWSCEPSPSRYSSLRAPLPGPLPLRPRRGRTPQRDKQRARGRTVLLHITSVPFFDFHTSPQEVVRGSCPKLSGDNFLGESRGGGRCTYFFPTTTAMLQTLAIVLFIRLYISDPPCRCPLEPFAPSGRLPKLAPSRANDMGGVSIQTHCKARVRIIAVGTEEPTSVRIHGQNFGRKLSQPKLVLPRSAECFPGQPPGIQPAKLLPLDRFAQFSSIGIYPGTPLGG